MILKLRGLDTRRVPLPHCLRRWLRLRRLLLLLQWPPFYSDSDPETAWPPSVFVQSLFG